MRGTSMYAETAADALARLRTALPELRRQLASTTRPTAHGWTWLDETARDRRDAQIRAERAERVILARRGLAPIGGAHAPLNLTVLDALRDIELDLAELEAAVCERVAPDLAPSPTADARLDRLDDLLGQVAADYDLAKLVAQETSRLAALAGRILGDAEPVLRVDGRCPHCDALSLRAFPNRLLILCVNRACQCEDWLCGCRDEHRPTRHEWRLAEWYELAAHLEAA